MKQMKQWSFEIFFFFFLNKLGSAMDKISKSLDVAHRHTKERWEDTDVLLWGLLYHLCKIALVHWIEFRCLIREFGI